MMSKQAQSTFGSRTLSLLKYLDALNTTVSSKFVPHRAVLYVQIRPESMGLLKSCQLQLSLENEGINEALATAPDLRLQYIVGTNGEVWAPDKFDATGHHKLASEKGYLLRMEANMTTAMLQQFLPYKPGMLEVRPSAQQSCLIEHQTSA